MKINQSDIVQYVKTRLQIRVKALHGEDLTELSIDLRKLILELESIEFMLDSILDAEEFTHD